MQVTIPLKLTLYVMSINQANQCEIEKTTFSNTDDYLEPYFEDENLNDKSDFESACRQYLLENDIEELSQHMELGIILTKEQLKHIQEYKL